MPKRISRSGHHTEPETDPHILFREIRHSLNASFERLNCWGWTPNGDSTFRKMQEERISNYLNQLQEEERSILSKFLEERRTIIERYASPAGAWYLFTVKEGVDRINRQGENRDVGPKELEFFAEHFFEKWSEEGRRTFTPDEVEEIHLRESYEPHTPRETLEAREYSTENEYEFYADVWRNSYMNSGILIQTSDTEFRPGFVTVELNRPESRRLFEAFHELRTNLQGFTTPSSLSSLKDKGKIPMNPILSTEVRQVSLEYKEKYKDLPVPQKVIALVDDYKGIQLTTNSNHQKNTFDRSGKQVSVSRANRPYFIAIASLLNQYERDLPTAHLSLDTIGVSPDSIETERDQFGRLAPIAARIVEEHSQDEFTETTADFGAKLLPFFDAALALLYGEQEESVLPKILQDLCEESTSPASKFYPVRQFLESLERYEGKLVWPNTRRTSGSTHFVRKYDLALLVYHLKLKDGFRFPLEEWASYARESFVWNDYSAVSNNELRRYISDERKSRKVDELKDSTVVRLIRNLYE